MFLPSGGKTDVHGAR